MRRFGLEFETDERFTRRKVKSIVKKNSKIPCVISDYITTDIHSWNVKMDSTCGSKGKDGPKGVEIVSYVGSTQEDLCHMADMAGILKSSGCQVNKNCGYHIHVEVNDYSIYQIGILLSYWIKIEPFLSNAFPSFRNNNKYCVLINNKIVKINDHKIDMKSFALKKDFKLSCVDVWNLLKPRNLNTHYNTDRRYTINLVNYSRNLHKVSNRNTLEFRWPEGTLDRDDVLNWCLFFLSFIEKCKDIEMPKDIKPFDECSALEFLKLNDSTEKWLKKRILKYS